MYTFGHNASSDNNVTLMSPLQSTTISTDAKYFDVLCRQKCTTLWGIRTLRDGSQ